MCSPSIQHTAGEGGTSHLGNVHSCSWRKLSFSVNELYSQLRTMKHCPTIPFPAASNVTLHIQLTVAFDKKLSHLGSAHSCRKRRLYMCCVLTLHIYNLRLWAMENCPIKTVPIPAGRDDCVYLLRSCVLTKYTTYSWGGWNVPSGQCAFLQLEKVEFLS